MSPRKFSRAEAYDILTDTKDAWQRYFDMTGRSLFDDAQMLQVVEQFEEDGTLTATTDEVWVQIYDKGIKCSLGPDEGTLAEFKWMDFQSEVQDALEKADLKIEEEAE